MRYYRGFIQFYEDSDINDKTKKLFIFSVDPATTSTDNIVEEEMLFGYDTLVIKPLFSHRRVAPQSEAVKLTCKRIHRRQAFG